MLNQDTFNTLKTLLDDEFETFLSVFLTDTETYIQEILTAQQIGDYALRTRLAHTVKSSLATVGAVEMSGLAETIEDAKEDEDMTATWQELSDNYHQLVPYLSSLS